MTITAVQSRIAELRLLIGQPTPATTTTTGDLSAAFTAALNDASTASSTTASALTGQDLITSASKYLGVDYVWGGESLSEGGLDCSGLVQLAMSDIGGPDMPRTAREQQNVGQQIDSLAQAQPGDLLFFGDPATHVAIYVGDGQMLDAPKPGGTVDTREVYTTPTTIRRVLPAQDTTPSVTTDTALAAADTQRAMLNILSSLTSTGATS